MVSTKVTKVFRGHWNKRKTRSCQGALMKGIPAVQLVQECYEKYCFHWLLLVVPQQVWGLAIVQGPLAPWWEHALHAAYLFLLSSCESWYNRVANQRPALPSLPCIKTESLPLLSTRNGKSQLHTPFSGTVQIYVSQEHQAL